MSLLPPDILHHALANPLWLSDVSAWVQHIPFAGTLMALTRPRTFVELGTHKADSYFAFCQTAKTLALPIQCTAIDTWSGDPQAGQYASDILVALRAHHDPLYGSFSRLLQSTFDDAAPNFADGSIDLLHIDGLHTYDAVRHDFNTWRPKLSDRGVVIFHDTAVTTGDFGVHCLWREITQGPTPHFAFTHGYGLGILALGPHAPQPLLDFLAFANAHPQPVRDLFAALGHRLELARAVGQLRAQLRSQLVLINQWRSLTNQSPLQPPPGLAIADDSSEAATLALNCQADDPKARLGELHHAATELTADLGHALTDHISIRQSLAHQEHRVAELTTHTQNLQTECRRLDDWRQQLQTQVTHIEAELQAATAQLAAATARLEATQGEVARLAASRYLRLGQKLVKLPLMKKLLGIPDPPANT